MITIIFCAFDWQENLWGMNFHGHGSLVGTIVVGFAKYSSYCKLIFVDKRHTYYEIPKTFTLQKIISLN